MQILLEVATGVYNTCLNTLNCMAATVVLPTSPMQNQNQASLKPTERVIVKPCIYCTNAPLTRFFVHILSTTTKLTDADNNGSSHNEEWIATKVHLMSCSP